MLLRLTIEQLAERVDKSTNYIGQIERNDGKPSLESNKPQELSKGSRVGQLVITPVVIADFVSELGEQRGKGGFGSTGK